MQPIIIYGLTKAGISSTLHMAVRYGPRYPCGIGIFDLVVIQGSVRTDFLIKCCWEPTPYSPFLHAKLFTIQLEAG